MVQSYISGCLLHSLLGRNYRTREKKERNSLWKRPPILLASSLPHPIYEGSSEARLLDQNFICAMLAIRGRQCYMSRSYCFSSWEVLSCKRWPALRERLSCKSGAGYLDCPEYLDWTKLGRRIMSSLLSALSDKLGLEGRENIWQNLVPKRFQQSCAHLPFVGLTLLSPNWTELEAHIAPHTVHPQWLINSKAQKLPGGFPLKSTLFMSSWLAGWLVSWLAG